MKLVTLNNLQKEPKNPLTALDSYKLGHAAQYPDGTQKVYINFTPRSLMHAHFFNNHDIPEKIVVFGIQATIMKLHKFWHDNFFSLSPEEFEQSLVHFLKVVNPFLAGNKFDVTHFRKLYEYRKLPLKIKSLPEGTLIDVKTPILTIVNTEPDFYWLPNFLETWLSAELWKVCTNATIALAYKLIIYKEYLSSNTPLNKDVINFLCHDFSERGMSGLEDAAFSGMGHLVLFKGTDNIPSSELVRYYYGSDLPEDYLIGASVPATEHSVMCVGSKFYEENNQNGELNLFKKLINEIYPKGIVSIVSDTWDFWKFITEYPHVLHDDIMSRDGKVVFRPDSGNPVDILTGYDYFNAPSDLTSDIHNEENCLKIQNYLQNNFWYNKPISRVVLKMENGDFVECSPKVDKENLTIHYTILDKRSIDGAVVTLYNEFGGTINEKSGLKNLDSHVGLIYGDSITTEVIEIILKRLKAKGFTHDNIVFGIGSFTYNFNTRDTLGFAVKATYAVIDNKGYNIFKAPKTDKNNIKKSAQGLLRVIKTEEGKIITLDNQTPEEEEQGLLTVLYQDGLFNQDHIVNIEQVRQTVDDNIMEVLTLHLKNKK